MRPSLFPLWALLAVSAPSVAQSTRQTALAPAEARQTAQAATRLLNEQYVFPEVAAQMERHIHDRLRSYEALTDGYQLARQLTADLQSICHDQHVHMTYFPEGVPQEQLWQKDLSPAEMQQQKSYMQEGLRRENFGILGVSVLKGNLGYINFKYLAPPEFAGESYSAALNYLARTDALIIDLRQCHGAMSEHAIPMLCSYFFDEPTHLNDFYWRTGNRTVQSWTYAQVSGRHYGKKPIYILTSRQTFSGAEELAYDLKNLKRATLVGDTTKGGANPGETMRVNDHFALFVPHGRAINPITHTNWEGVGVAPDTLVSANRALYAAQLMALGALAKQTTLAPDWRQALQGIAAELRSQPPRYVVHTFALKGFADAKAVYVAGSFNNWSSQTNRLVRKGNAWVSDIEVEPGKVAYKFIVDGQWFTDPQNSRTESEGQHINSVIEIALK
ncbi:S41 family peptidase [Fibrella sp. WM1]|uniref:S41 family peptidase n=1 Tax=Fibrella musci TaxID=3242485 RepID=UPI003522A59A